MKELNTDCVIELLDGETGYDIARCAGRPKVGDIIQLTDQRNDKHTVKVTGIPWEGLYRDIPGRFVNLIVDPALRNYNELLAAAAGAFGCTEKTRIAVYTFEKQDSIPRVETVDWSQHDPTKVGGLGLGFSHYEWELSRASLGDRFWLDADTGKSELVEVTDQWEGEYEGIPARFVETAGSGQDTYSKLLAAEEKAKTGLTPSTYVYATLYRRLQ